MKRIPHKKRHQTDIDSDINISELIKSLTNNQISISKFMGRTAYFYTYDKVIDSELYANRSLSQVKPVSHPFIVNINQHISGKDFNYIKTYIDKT